MQAGFEPGKTVLAPAIGGSVGNAVTQLAKAQGAQYAISTTTSTLKAQQAKTLGYENVIDLSSEALADSIKRITGGRGADIVIESVGGSLTGQALSALAPNGALDYIGILGWSHGETIDLTDLIWKRARMSGFSLFAQPPAIIAEAWSKIIPQFASPKCEASARKSLPIGGSGKSNASFWLKIDPFLKAGLC